MQEATLVVLKPDGISKCLTGDVITRLSHEDLEIAGAKIVKVSRELAEEHYLALKDEPFYDQIVRYIMGEFHNQPRTLALVYTGKDVIKRVRAIAGATNPEEADPHTVRGAYGRIHTQNGLFENIIHASSCPEDAKREIKLWFHPYELAYDIYPEDTVDADLKLKAWK
jgi:nucleoside-diphosphate kinase